MIDRLFLPLNKDWYNLFAAGRKKWEMRGYSPRFNEKTVRIGRSVELRKGYIKEGAIWGVISEVHVTNSVYDVLTGITKELFPIPANSPLWEYIQLVAQGVPILQGGEELGSPVSYLCSQVHLLMCVLHDLVGRSLKRQGTLDRRDKTAS